MRVPYLTALFLCAAAASATAAVTDTGRLNIATLEQPAFRYEPTQPLWEKKPIAAPAARESERTAKDNSPLRLNGSMLRAPDERKNTAPAADGDPMSRFTEQRLLDNYGTKGWEQMAIDGQLRLAPQNQKSGFAPYVTGGMGVTQLSSGTFANDPAVNGAVGLRYGAGVAYNLGDEFDLTAGYRVNRMDERPGSSVTGDRLNMQMLDFGLRYKY